MKDLQHSKNRDRKRAKRNRMIVDNGNLKRIQLALMEQYGKKRTNSTNSN